MIGTDQSGRGLTRLMIPDHFLISFLFFFDPKMVLLIEKCAQLLQCPKSALRDRLNHPSDRSTVMAALIGRQVRTTYLDRNGFAKTFFISDLSTQGADALMAYGRLCRPFNINVSY